MAERNQDPKERLAARFGADSVLTDGLPTISIDGCVPRALVAPASPEEAAEILAFARAEGLRVMPIGGGTRLGLGAPPAGIDLLLSTRRLNRILDYAPADFVITVQSGMTLAALGGAVSANRQRLALDPPALPPSTLGGALSADASGPHRYLYGTARDLVIGLEAALPNGTVMRSGGRVVKNVAGYDLKKLYLGALGSLGVITSVSIKLHPIPEDETVIVASFPDYKCAGDATAALLRAGYELSVLDLLNRAALEDLDAEEVHEGASCGLILSLAGTRSSNEAQASEIAVLCARSGSLSTRARHGDDARSVWERLGELCAPAPSEAANGRRITARLSVPVGEVSALAERVESVFADTASPRLIARGGNGVLYLYLEAPPSQRPEAPLRALRGEAIARGGNLVLEEAPAALKQTLDVWGSPVRALRLHRRIKEAFDPAGTLVPGRFVAGL